jgi:hypothetical protein
MTEPEDLIRTGAWVIPDELAVKVWARTTKKDPWWKRALRWIFG